MDTKTKQISDEKKNYNRNGTHGVTNTLYSAVMFVKQFQ